MNKEVIALLRYCKQRLQEIINHQFNISYLQFKSLFLVLNLMLFVALLGEELQAGIVKGLLIILGLNIIVGIYYYFSQEEENQVAQVLAAILDLSFISLLVYHSGGLESPFLLAYIILLARIGIKRQELWQVILIGLTGHLIYVITLYLHYNRLEFYFTMKFWIECLLFAGVLFGLVIVVRMIDSQRKSLEKRSQKLQERSITDVVTGLYNFRYFHRRLEEELNYAQAGSYSLTLIMIDLDNFKEYNRHVGAEQGDQALYQVGQILKQVTRDNDVVTRLNSDEFAVIMIDASKELAKETSIKIKDAIREYSFVGEEELAQGVLTASLGLATYSDYIETPQELINNADEALYKVKLSHKNGIQVYNSMFAELKRELEGTDSSLLNTLRTLLTVVNARDRYTYGHSERVMKYAMAIGEELGISTELLRILKYAAFLHDVGKIEVSRDILNKKGKLNKSEWDLIKQHTIFGVNIVEPLDDLDEIVPAIMHHHERYDGTGYPYGLEGKDIPLLARILTVADSFDAMTSNRPYRSAMGQEEAVNELKANKGGQFDPKIVDAFTQVVGQVFKKSEFHAS